jgi:hypothetical protein
MKYAPYQFYVRIMKHSTDDNKRSKALLLSSLYGFAVLTGNDFDLIRLYMFVAVHLESRILDDERPYIITQTIRVQMALKYKKEKERRVR